MMHHVGITVHRMVILRPSSRRVRGASVVKAKRQNFEILEL